MRYLNSADIRLQQEKVAEQSRESFKAGYNKFNAAIDALLIIQYSFSLPKSSPSTPLQRVHNLATKWLYLSIFGFQASLSLAEQGFYMQSIGVNRNLMESLVSAYYLIDKPEDIDRIPMVSNKVKRALTMRERFDHVIPGYYDLHYKFSSEFAHPSHGSHVTKMQPDGQGGYNVDLGASFDLDWMSLCLNEIFMLLGGFLKAYSVKYKAVLHYRDSADIDQIGDAIKGILEILYGHIALKGLENSWHTTTRPLWDW